jgi:hypothetical protein
MVNSSTTNVAVTTVSNGMFTGDYRTSKYTWQQIYFIFECDII